MNGEMDFEQERQAIHQGGVTLAEAWDKVTTQNGIPPLMTMTASALLIGKIAGCSGNDEDQLERGLGVVFDLIRMTAKQWLAGSAIKH